MGPDWLKEEFVGVPDAANEDAVRGQLWMITDPRRGITQIISMITVYYIEVSMTWLTIIDTVAGKNPGGWNIFRRVHTSQTPMDFALSD